MNIGDRIKGRREELGYTQDEVAKKLGYAHRSSVQKIETSREVPMKKIQKYAEALDTTVPYLMGWQDELAKIDTDVAVDIMSNPKIMEYAKKLMQLSENSQRTIFDNIDFLAKKEGRD